LPAKYQLACLYDNKNTLGEFITQEGYWSASESMSTPATNAWYQNFSTGDFIEGSKDTPLGVRCVRSY
jgi:hypothetical protein